MYLHFSLMMASSIFLKPSSGILNFWLPILRNFRNFKRESKYFLFVAADSFFFSKTSGALVAASTKTPADTINGSPSVIWSNKVLIRATSRARVTPLFAVNSSSQEEKSCSSRERPSSSPAAKMAPFDRRTAFTFSSSLMTTHVFLRALYSVIEACRNLH